MSRKQNKTIKILYLRIILINFNAFNSDKQKYTHIYSHTHTDLSRCQQTPAPVLVLHPILSKLIDIIDMTC